MQQGNIYLITLGYVPNKLFKHTAKRLCDSLSGKWDIERYFVAKPYPKDTEENFELNLHTCRKYGYEYLHRDVDLGAAQDLNKTLDLLKLKPEDLVILYDHDIYPIDDNWDDAAISVLYGNSRVDWVSLWNPASDNEFGERGGKATTIAGYSVIRAITPMLCMCSVIRGSLLLHTGGLLQPCPYYGGVEIAMWRAFIERDSWKVFLPHYKEDQRLKEYEDQEYRDWKRAHTFGENGKFFKGTFAQYLEDKKAQP